MKINTSSLKTKALSTYFPNTRTKVINTKAEVLPNEINSNSKCNRKNTQNGEVQSKQKSIPKKTLLRSVEGIFEVATTEVQKTLIADKGNTAIIPIKIKEGIGHVDCVTGSSTRKMLKTRMKLIMT